MERKSTILIADDEVVIRDTLARILSDENYELAFATDGQEALAKAAELTPDLILLDVMMPVMNGFEVCRRLRADPLLAQVPVVMVTAMSNYQARLRGIEVGADDFLAKPFNEIELRTRVRTITRLDRYRRLLQERTQRQRAEQALSETEAIARVLLQAPTDAVALLDADGKILEANETVGKKLGRPVKEIVGSNTWDMLPPEVAERRKAIARKVIESGEPIRFKDQARGRWDDIAIYPVQDEKGATSKVAVLARDITDQVKAEEKEQQYIRELQFLSGAASGLVELPLEGDIYRFIGETLQKVIGDAVLTVSSFDEASNSLELRALFGLGEKTEAMLRIMGQNPIGTAFEIDEGAKRELISGKLRRVPGGIYDLSPDMPKAICRALEKLLNLGEIYAMGFSWEGRLFGNAVIFTRRGQELAHKELVETFLSQASVALQRRQAKAALAELNATLEERVRQRTFDLQVLHDFARQIGHIGDLDQLVRLVLGNLDRAVPHNVCASILTTRTGYRSYLQVARPLTPEVQQEIEEQLVSTFNRMSKEELKESRTQIAIQTFEAQNFDDSGPPVSRLNSVFQVPLIAGQPDVIDGLLFIGSDREEAFTEDHVRLLYTVASQASLFLSIRRSEEALRESEETARALLNATNDRAMLTDLEGTILAANKMAAHNAERDIEEMIGTSAYSLLAPELARSRRAQAEKAIASGEPVHFEDREAGSILDHTLYPVRDAQGNVARLAAFARDITAWKRAEEALKYRVESEKLISNISTLFIQLDPEDVESGIDFALKAVGTFAGVDRCYLFVLSEDEKTLENTHEWCAPGIEPQIERSRELPTARFPWGMEKLRRLQSILVPSVADLPPEAAEAKAFQLSRDAKAFAAVPLVYSMGLVGFIGLDAVREEQPWNPSIVSLLKMVGEIVVNALERKRSNAQIVSALQEKEILLKEIHHRVKNNLQVVSSLLKLQSKYIEDPYTLEVFKESQTRVKTMALVHERLYRSEDVARIDFADYIRNLTRDMFRSYRSPAAGVSLNIEAEDIFLDVETATPCGLIVNELISNALKHAFPDGKGGEISVTLSSNGDDFVLVVRDDGVGMPEELSSGRPDSLGLKLVLTLVQQLRGTLDVCNNQGTTFRIQFSVPGD